jgi:hypothetical protein
VGGTKGYDVARRALAQAIEKAGGAEALAARLSIAPGALRMYLMGSERIPDRLFLRIVDVLQPQPESPDGGA